MISERSAPDPPRPGGESRTAVCRLSLADAVVPVKYRPRCVFLCLLIVRLETGEVLAVHPSWLSHPRVSIALLEEYGFLPVCVCALRGHRLWDFREDLLLRAFVPGHQDEFISTPCSTAKRPSLLFPPDG